MRYFLVGTISTILMCQASPPSRHIPSGPPNGKGPPFIMASVSPTTISPTGIGTNCFNGASPAVPNDGKDDTAAFLCALHQLRPTGGILHVPSGTFEISDQLVIPQGTYLEGETSAGGGEPYTFPATVLHQAKSLHGAMIVLLSQTALSRIKFTQDHPAPNSGWAPDESYDFVVSARGSDIKIENVLFYPAFKAIQIAQPGALGPVGRVRLEDVRGQVFDTGIEVDNALDVVRLSQINFWDYWSYAPSVLEYQKAHSYGIRSLRNDNPLFSRIFMIHMHTCMEFAQSHCPPQNEAVCGVTSKPKVSQFDCDISVEGVRVDADNTKGLMLSEFSYQGFKGNGTPFAIYANHVTALISQADFTNVGGNAVRVNGSACTVSVSQAIVRSWNTSHKDFPAFEVVDGYENDYLDVAHSFVGNGNGADACEMNGAAGECNPSGGVSL